MKYNIKRAFNAAQYIKQETREKRNWNLYWDKLRWTKSMRTNDEKREHE